MKFWRSAVKVIVNHQHELRQGRPLGLSMLDEFLLTIVRLRRAFAERQLSWISLLFFELGSIPIWQSKDLIWETMPIAFKESHPCL